MQEKLYLGFFKIIFVIIPIGLISGPFIPDLGITLMTILFIFLSFKKNLWKEYYDYNLIKFLFLLNFYFIFSSLFSENILYSLKSSLFYFRFIIFSIAVWYLLNNINKSFIKNYTIYLIILFLILSIDATYQYANGQNIIGLKIIHSNRASSFFSDQLVLGSFQSRLLILILGLFIAFKVFKKNIIILNIFLLFTCASIFLSGERTSFALFVISLVLFLFLSKISVKFKLSIITSIALIFLILLTDKGIRYRLIIEPLHQSNLASEKLIKNYSDQKKIYVHEDNKILIFSKEHTAHYKTAYKIFLGNKLFGVGPKMFRYKCSNKEYNSGNLSCSTHPHNFLLQVLAETGIIGLIFYLVMIFFIINKMLIIFRKNNSNNDFIQLCCLILFFINLFPLLPSGNIFNNWLSIIFYFPLGFYLHALNQKKEQKYI